MKTIEKYIIDKDDEEYFYCEKIIGDFNNIIYRVYYSETFYESLNVYEYSESFGNYYKGTITEFLNFVCRDMLGYEDKVLYNRFRFLKKRFSSFNINPNLYKQKKLLLEAIYKYDLLISDKSLIHENYYDYEQDIIKLEACEFEQNLLRIKKDNL